MQTRDGQRQPSAERDVAARAVHIEEQVVIGTPHEAREQDYRTLVMVNIFASAAAPIVTTCAKACQSMTLNLNRADMS